MASCRRTNMVDIGSHYAASRQSYHWLMTKHELIKEKIVPNTDGAEDCSCHAVACYGNGNLQQYPLIRETICQDSGGHDEQSWHSIEQQSQPIMNLTTKVSGLGRPQLCVRSSTVN
jgi:hypothetical protein